MKMSWNYRVAKYVSDVEGEEPYYGIVETYYNGAGEICATSLGTVNAYGETVEDLKADLEHMLTALDKEVIEPDKMEYADFD